MIRPSPNFEFGEFTVSDTYPELAKLIQLTDLDKFKIFLLCRMHLQPLREKLGLPIRIQSGKRSPELNSKVGGAATSEHLYLNETAAVDFTVPGADMKAIYHGLILSPRSFSQCIWYKTSNFIHLGLPSLKHSGQFWETDK